MRRFLKEHKKGIFMAIFIVFGVAILWRPVQADPSLLKAAAIAYVGVILWDHVFEKPAKRLFLRWLDWRTGKDEAVFIDPRKE